MDRRRDQQVPAVLYGLQGSAPSFCAELMLRHKEIPYRRVDLIGGRHRWTLRAKGFPGGTVPALVLDGRPVQTNPAIARALDELVPDPPLFPADPGLRARVEEAERFTDEVFQDAVRRTVIWSTFRDPDSVRAQPANGRVPIPRSRWRRALVLPLAFRLYGITAAVHREDIAALPAMLDRIDGYVSDGVLNGPQLTAADLELGPVVAALMGIADNGPEIARRPVAALVSRVMPDEVVMARGRRSWNGSARSACSHEGKRASTLSFRFAYSLNPAASNACMRVSNTSCRMIRRSLIV